MKLHLYSIALAFTIALTASGADAQLSGRQVSQFDSVDYDQNGYVSFDEFYIYAIDIGWSDFGAVYQFGSADANGDDYLSPGEFATVGSDA